MKKCSCNGLAELSGNALDFWLGDLKYRCFAGVLKVLAVSGLINRSRVHFRPVARHAAALPAHLRFNFVFESASALRSFGLCYFNMRSHWSTANASTPNIRCAITLAAPRTRT